VWCWVHCFRSRCVLPLVRQGPTRPFFFLLDSTAAARVRRPPFSLNRIARSLLHSRSRVLVLQGELARSIFWFRARRFSPLGFVRPESVMAFFDFDFLSPVFGPSPTGSARAAHQPDRACPDARVHACESWISHRSVRCLVPCLGRIVSRAPELGFSVSILQRWFFTRVRVSILQPIFDSPLQSSVLFPWISRAARTVTLSTARICFSCLIFLVSVLS
jgi:hypothetical protein